MSAGKAAAQACHAARLSLLRFLEQQPDRAAEFLQANSVGSVVVLDAPTFADLDRAAVLASRHDLPWALFLDSDHGSSPIPTALAIGPADRRRIKPLVRHYPLTGENS